MKPQKNIPIVLASGPPQDIPLVLASTSPRRIELLRGLCLPIEILSPESEEIPKKGEKPEDLVARLSREKAESVRSQAWKKYGKCLIIAADTVVVTPNGREILGKPRDRDDARRILQLLLGKTHTVMTGYDMRLLSEAGDDKVISRVVKSRVKMRSIDSVSLEHYLKTGESLDKAGGYGAQGFGMALIEEIRGSYTNVVGLPLAHIMKDFEKILKIKLFSWIDL